MFIAQAADINLIDAVTGRNVPTQLQCAEYLQTLALWVSIPMTILGVVYLLFGARAYKPLVIANAVAAGALLGGYVGDASNGENSNMLLFGAIAGGVLFAVLAMVLTRGAVAVIGVLVGGLMGFGGWVYVAMLFDRPRVASYAWAGGIIGLVALGMLAYANFKLAVKVFTAFQGAVMIAAGAVALLMLNVDTGDFVRLNAEQNVHFLPAMIIVPSVLGLAVQHVSTARKGKGGAKPAG